MKTHIRKFLTLLILTIPISSIAETKDIIIFTTADYPITQLAANISVYYLDVPEKLTSETFSSLPADSKSAEQQARKIMSSSEWQQQDAALRESFKGVIKAWSLGIEKVPAIVMEGRFVVYGTTNVEVAREKLKQFQGGH